MQKKRHHVKWWTERKIGKKNFFNERTQKKRNKGQRERECVRVCVCVCVCVCVVCVCVRARERERERECVNLSVGGGGGQEWVVCLCLSFVFFLSLLSIFIERETLYSFCVFWHKVNYWNEKSISHNTKHHYFVPKTTTIQTRDRHLLLQSHSTAAVTARQVQNHQITGTVWVTVRDILSFFLSFLLLLSFSILMEEDMKLYEPQQQKLEAQTSLFLWGKKWS